VSDQFQAPVALPTGTKTRYPLDRRLGGPHSRSERREEVKILAPPGFKLRPLGRSVSSQSLYRLRYPRSRQVVTLNDDDDDEVNIEHDPNNITDLRHHPAAGVIAILTICHVEMDSQSVHLCLHVLSPWLHIV
jgi:hypothetical protein